MVEEAIILAGGLGTRLRSVVKDVPKPMAEVNGHPFLDYILYYLAKNNIKRVVLAVGYKHEIIQEYLAKDNNALGLTIDYSIEHELLGTGGAISQALNKIQGDHAFIVNGDTFFDISLNALEEYAMATSSDIAIALKQLPYSDRYGQITFADDGRISSFSAKNSDYDTTILINGGIYYVKKNIFEEFNLPSKFSIEQEFFQPHINDIAAYGKVFDNTFIDIGIPHDFELAQNILKNVKRQ